MNELRSGNSPKVRKISGLAFSYSTGPESRGLKESSTISMVNVTLAV